MDLETQSPNGSSDVPEFESKSPGGTTKGYGLKKWRRIRRDVVKDGAAGATGVDTSKILKRPNNNNNNNSTATKPNRMVAVDSRNVFAAGTDSENSEDRSSKSSTAASAPKVRYNLPAPRGKGMASQPQKGKMENSKKHRGERVRIEKEKENSHSSIESDSRSSNFSFMQQQQQQHVNSNGNGNQMSFEGENSASEQHFGEEIQTKENVGEVEDSHSLDDSAADASWNVKDEETQNNRFSSDRDPLLQSMLTLQSVQEALEKEVQKLAEIGKEHLLPDNSMEGGSLPSDFASPGIQEPCTSNQLGSEKSTQMDVSSLQEKVLSLEQNVKILQSKLDEANTLLVVKESKVSELEATINSTKFLKEESGSTIDLHEKKYTEIEDELEGLFKQRIEAEVEFLAITRATQSLKVVAEKQITLLEEQETVAKEQVQMLNKLGNAEIKTAKLKKQAQELENHCGDILETEEVLVTQRGVYKVTWCFCTQLILLILVLWLFILQLSSHPGAVVPT